MKKCLSIFIVLFILIANILILTSCTETPYENETEITVFAASSMTETLTEIAQIYESENEDIKITYNFDSSGTLKTQIEEGAYCDLFISASATPMDNLSCVDNDSRIDLLQNKVVLVAPNGNPKNISSFDDMVDKLVNNELLIAIGNFDVPVGEYTMRIFDYYNLSVVELDENSSITYGSNAKEVTTQVSEGLVDCGIIYQTDAFSANLEIIDTADVSMCGKAVYPAALLDITQHKKEANEFLEFLKSDKATKVFSEVGFTPLV